MTGTSRSHALLETTSGADFVRLPASEPVRDLPLCHAGRQKRKNLCFGSRGPRKPHRQKTFRKKRDKSAQGAWAFAISSAQARHGKCADGGPPGLGT